MLLLVLLIVKVKREQLAHSVQKVDALSLDKSLSIQSGLMIIFRLDRWWTDIYSMNIAEVKFFCLHFQFQ